MFSSMQGHCNHSNNLSGIYFFREWDKSIPLTNIKFALPKLQTFTLFQDYSQNFKSRYTFISTSQTQYYNSFSSYTFNTSYITIQLYTTLKNILNF